jgi:hypothetical protein
LLKNINIKLPYNPVIPLLGIYPKNFKAETQILVTCIFIAALFTITQTWKQAKCHQQTKG